MAIFLPQHQREDAPIGEKKVFEAFKALDDDWTIFSHIIWQSLRRGKEGDGEIDFLLFHQNFGLLNVEIKGGSIDIENGQWYSIGGGGRFSIKNPFEQAIANKYGLLKILQEQGLSNIPVNHAVCFPDCSEGINIASYGPKEIVWWAPDLLNITVPLQRTTRHWNKPCLLDSKTFQNVRSLLAPTVSLRHRLIDDIGDVTEQLLRLTSEQLRVFESIQRNRRAIIQGGPGTGKTLLSIERARKLSEQGFNTLWTCYNELLANYVHKQFNDIPSITVRTFHSFCIKEIHAANLHIPQNPDGEFWEKGAPKLLLEAAAINGTTFDAIIIDEGQDFSQEWIDVLELLMAETKDAPFYVFADSNQKLYRRKWAFTNCMKLDLTINCRNSRPISRKVTNIFGEPPAEYGATGPEPIFNDISNERTTLDRISEKVTNIIEKERVSPNQITVLVDEENFAVKLKERYASQYPFASYGSKGVVVETIRRFKGLENDVIIVILAKTEEMKADDLRCLCYVAFSRPRVLLITIANPQIRKLLNW